MQTNELPTIPNTSRVLPSSRIFGVMMLILLFAAMATAQAQQPAKTQALDTSLSKLNDAQLKRYARQVKSNTAALAEKVNNTNQQQMAAMQKQEAKLQGKLGKVDSTLAKKLFNPTTGRLQKLQAFIQKNTGALGTTATGSTAYKEYMPFMDTLKTSMGFLQAKSSNVPLQAEATKAMASINGLQTQFVNAATIRNYLTQRNQELTAAFSKYGMGRQLNAYKEQAYYYRQQIQEYRTMAQDPKKLEETGIGILTKLPVFQGFMQKNSQLAALFPMPENYGTPQALAGLQTRASVQQLLQSKFGSAASSPSSVAAGSNSPLGDGGAGGSSSLQGMGAGGGGFIQQQLQSAQTQLSSLKDRLNNARNGSFSNSPSGVGGEVDSSFKPNSQKTKPFWKRLEYGFNIQSQRPDGLLPVTSNMALTVGYRLNDRNTVGIGASYNMGWGNGLNQIALSTQGAGLRSYWDTKIRNGFSITGGYEKNYMPVLQQRLTEFYTRESWPSWRPSLLLGVTKKVTIGKKKTSTMQLLYDFLYMQDHIQTQPLVFRVGWGF